MKGEKIDSRLFLAFVLVIATMFFVSGLWAVDISFTGKLLMEDFPWLEVVFTNGFWERDVAQAYHIGLLTTSVGFAIAVAVAFIGLNKRIALDRERSPKSGE